MLHTTRPYFQWGEWGEPVQPGASVAASVVRVTTRFWEGFYADVAGRDDRAVVQLRVRLVDGRVRSLSPMRVVERGERASVATAFAVAWRRRGAGYGDVGVASVAIAYRRVPDQGAFPLERVGRATGEAVRRGSGGTLHGYDLPVTMDVRRWGTAVYAEGGDAVTVYAATATYRVVVGGAGYRATAWSVGRATVTFWDAAWDRARWGTFGRVTGGRWAVCHAGAVRATGVAAGGRQGRALAPLSGSRATGDGFWTMDVETRTVGTALVPYCVSVFDGVGGRSTFAAAGEDASGLLARAMGTVAGYRGTVYLHNFARFDGVFLLRVLSGMGGTVAPVVRDGRLVEVAWRGVRFRDSYLLLPQALGTLATTFGVEPKGVFPHRFAARPSVPLDYVGQGPSGATGWGLRAAAVAHCERDCRVLHGVLSAFRVRVRAGFGVDPLGSRTVAALALTVYRTGYLAAEARVPLVGGALFADLHRGYTGGRVAVYRPSGRGVYRYDANSLYPGAIARGAMPVGVPLAFEGALALVGARPFGVFEAEVVAPSTAGALALQRRFRTEAGVRTVAPCGRWTGVYLSEELYAAVRRGYGVRVLRGVAFERGHPFKGFVTHLYGLKRGSERGSPTHAIAKLLLNALYGRLGMDPVREVHRVVDAATSVRLCARHAVSQVVPLSAGREWVAYRSASSDDGGRPSNVSVPIALAVTAHARVAMGAVPLPKGASLHYVDTDSVDVTGTVASGGVGARLGDMRLERFFGRAVFLSPKAYGGRTGEVEWVTVRGLAVGTPLSTLVALLYGEARRSRVQARWRRDVGGGRIDVANGVYTVAATEGTRRWVRDPSGRLAGSVPFVVDEALPPVSQGGVG